MLQKINEKFSHLEINDLRHKIRIFTRFSARNAPHCKKPCYNRSVVYGRTAGRKRTMQVELAAPVLKPTVETKSNA
jgi:hypothetical protein